jgi:hypothetical protein
MLPLGVSIFLCDRRCGSAGRRRCLLNLDRQAKAQTHGSAQNISAVLGASKILEICGAA